MYWVELDLWNSSWILGVLGLSASSHQVTLESLDVRVLTGEGRHADGLIGKLDYKEGIVANGILHGGFLFENSLVNMGSSYWTVLLGIYETLQQRHDCEVTLLT